LISKVCIENQLTCGETHDRLSHIFISHASIHHFHPSATVALCYTAEALFYSSKKHIEHQKKTTGNSWKRLPSISRTNAALANKTELHSAAHYISPLPNSPKIG
jgi:hypothetical protein